MVLFFYGLIAGSVATSHPAYTFSLSVHAYATASPMLYLNVLLPLLVFNDSLHLPTKMFGAMFWPATLLATAGVLIGAVFIAFFSWAALPMNAVVVDDANGTLGLTFYEAMTLGAITSATDPVAVSYTHLTLPTILLV